MCTTLFANSNYYVGHQHLSFVNDVTFENYLWEVDVHDEILRSDRCKAKLNEIRASIDKDGRESKSKLVYIEECALILHYFALEHILASMIGNKCCKSKNAQMRCNATVQDPESRAMGILRGCQRADCWAEVYSLTNTIFWLSWRTKRSWKRLLRRKVNRRLLRRSHQWERVILTVRWSF